MPVLKVIQIRWLLIIMFYLIFQINVYAEEIYLKNGDRLTGNVIEQNEETVTIETKAMGKISVNRDFILRIASAKEEKSPAASEEKLPAASKEVKKVIWQREISLGYNKSSGNTEISQLSMSVLANRKREHINEFTLKGNAYYSSSNEKMDAQKWYGMTRYAFSFGGDKKWYNFYKFEVDHDRFANINYRIIPAIGIGYWFYDLEEIKLMTELGMGLEHTNYRGQTENSDEAVLIPRAFFEKEIFGNSKISQDVFLYPQVEDFSKYRIHSETTLATSISQKLTLCFKLMDDYDSDPPQNTKENDFRFISSLAYSF